MGCQVALAQLCLGWRYCKIHLLFMILVLIIERAGESELATEVARSASADEGCASSRGWAGIIDHGSGDISIKRQAAAALKVLTPNWPAVSEHPVSV